MSVLENIKESGMFWMMIVLVEVERGGLGV